MEDEEGPATSHKKIMETDEDILKVKGLLTDFKYDGYKVETVAVKCSSDEVELGGKTLNNRCYNELDSVQRFFHKKPTKSAMKNLSKEEEKVRKLMTWIIRHMDKRSHQIIMRKCMKSLGEKVCSWCSKNPPKLSKEFVAALPPRSSGGLWFTPTSDPQRPGHFLTFLQQQELLKKQELFITPDSDLDVLRCQVTLGILGTS